MKAKELYIKFGERLRNPETNTEALKDLINEFINDMYKLIEIRNIKTDRGYLSLIKELNQKGNALANMFKPPLLKINWFEIYLNKKLEEIKVKIDEGTNK